MMSLEDYRQLIIGVTKMHIKTAQDELNNSVLTLEGQIRLEGHISGLEQAIYTLEKSEFLTKNDSVIKEDYDD